MFAAIAYVLFGTVLGVILLLTIAWYEGVKETSRRRMSAVVQKMDERCLVYVKRYDPGPEKRRL